MDGYAQLFATIVALLFIAGFLLELLLLFKLSYKAALRMSVVLFFILAWVYFVYSFAHSEDGCLVCSKPLYYGVQVLFFSVIVTSVALIGAIAAELMHRLFGKHFS